MDISTVFTFIRQVAATFLTLAAMFFPAAGHEYEVRNRDGLIMSFSAVSDVHVETNNPDSYKAFSSLLKGIKAGKDHSAAVFLGDNVMNGQLTENLLFYMGVKAVKPARNSFVACGNHDLGNGEGDYAALSRNFLVNNSLFLGNRLEKMYYSTIVNGCYMIFLASEAHTVNDFVMSEAQLEWLENTLEQAKADDAPVFVFNHHPINSCQGASPDTLADLLSGYDNLLYIYGHTHRRLGDYSFHTYKSVDCINLPRSTEQVYYEAGDGIVVEVYADEIIVRGRNFITGEWIEGIELSYSLNGENI